jgi:hypothetical protein
VPKYKGTRYETIRKVMHAQGKSAEQAFLAKLTPEEHEKYLYGLPVSWYLVEEILFPNDPQGLRKVGRLNARESLTGIYKLFLRIPSIDFVIGRIAKLWRSYQDTGEAVTRNYTGKSIEFVLKGYPDLRMDFREYLCGYIIGFLELAGAHNPKIDRDDSNSDALVWKAYWD